MSEKIQKEKKKEPVTKNIEDFNIGDIISQNGMHYKVMEKYPDEQRVKVYNEKISYTCAFNYGAVFTLYREAKK